MASSAFDGRLFLTACLVSLALAGVAYAEDPPAAKASNAEQAGNAQGEAEEETADRYQVPPDANVEQLLEYVQELRAYKPQTRIDAAMHQRKVGPATKKALERMREVATEQDRSQDPFKDAMDMLLMVEVRSAQLGSAEDMDRALNDLRAALKDNADPSDHLVAAARSTASFYEFRNDSRGAQLYAEFGERFANSANEKTALTGRKMQGAARRLNLVGQPLELSGTLMDGGTFDWGSYRGKVVLVDFWATWCGPCLRELPNVKANYELYHDKGFEVVAVSLDNDREALVEFLKKEPKPWVTLHDGPWNDNQVATYYGVMGIPTVILVDKEGKVVSTRARGAELGRLLEQQLGPVDLKKDAAEEAADAGAAGETKTSE